MRSDFVPKNRGDIILSGPNVVHKQEMWETCGSGVAGRGSHGGDLLIRVNFIVLAARPLH